MDLAAVVYLHDSQNFHNTARNVHRIQQGIENAESVQKDDSNVPWDAVHMSRGHKIPGTATGRKTSLVR